MKLNLEKGLNIAFYNTTNYDSPKAANAGGALYTAPSPISLYGSSGLFDLQEIVDTLLNCIGNVKGFVCVICTEEGDYIPLNSAIKPEPLECWINVYADGTKYFYDTEKDAEKDADHGQNRSWDRCRCVHMMEVEE